MSRQQAFNYAHTLLSAVEDVEKFKSQNKETSAVIKEANEQDCV
jgi:hypothetical protein